METLFRCTRCNLLFGWEGIPDACPACLRRTAIAPRIEAAGRDVTEFVIRNTRDDLLVSGVGRLNLGQCGHGWLTPAICPQCSI